MNSDIEIIKLVVANLHSAIRLNSLSYLYAPDFKFKSPLRGWLNFDEHLQHLNSISNSSEMNVLGISEKKDHYLVEMEFTILHSDSRKISNLKATAKVFMDEGIIYKMTTKYKPTALQLAYILKSTIAFTKPL